MMITGMKRNFEIKFVASTAAGKAKTAAAAKTQPQPPKTVYKQTFISQAIDFLEAASRSHKSSVEPINPLLGYSKLPSSVKEAAYDAFEKNLHSVCQIFIDDFEKALVSYGARAAKFDDLDTLFANNRISELYARCSDAEAAELIFAYSTVGAYVKPLEHLTTKTVLPMVAEGGFLHGKATEVIDKVKKYGTLATAIKENKDSGCPHFTKLVTAVANVVAATALSKPEEPPTCTRALLKDQAIAQLSKDALMKPSAVLRTALDQ